MLARRRGKRRVFNEEAAAMATLGLSHYNLRAPRELMQALCAFYCEVVGLSVGPRPPFNSFGYWLYAGSRAVVHLSESGPGGVGARGVEAAGTFDHAAFDCTDLAGTRERLARLGIVYRTAMVPELGHTQLFLLDPAGNGVELIFDRQG